MTVLKDVTEFVAWSSETTCGTFSTHVRSWYTVSQANVVSVLHETDFFARLPQTINLAAEVYGRDHGVKLFAFDRTPSLDWNKKGYESFLNKLFRLNCVENANFPSPPVDGWCSLQRSFELVDDIVRTTIVVAYADGPAIVATHLKEAAEAQGLEVRVKDHAKEKGYYAYHVYVSLPVTIGSLHALNEYPTVKVPIEIQITTELQGVLREITHQLYESERDVGSLGSDWKSQFSSGRFRAAYMAHSLRFIEAMIVDLRQTTLSKKGILP